MTTEEQIQEFLKQGEILMVEQLLSSLPQAGPQMVILHILLNVFRTEVEQEAPVTIFDYSLDIAELAGHFIRLKLYIRRLEFDIPLKYQKELWAYCSEHNVSEYLILSILLTNIFRRERACRRLIQIIEEMEGAGSQKAGYFRQVLSYLEGQGNE